jgi:hypothetical protein
MYIVQIILLLISIGLLIVESIMTNDFGNGTLYGIIFVLAFGVVPALGLVIAGALSADCINNIRRIRDEK